MKTPIELPEKLRRDGREKWRAFTDAAGAAGLPRTVDDTLGTALQRVFALSDFVAESCIRHPGTAVGLIDSGDLTRAYAPGRYGRVLGAALLGEVAGDAPFSETEARIPPSTGRETSPAAMPATPDIPWLQHVLRKVRRREMVRIAFRDLAGLADLAETMADLSDFADACLDRSLDILQHWQRLRHGTPFGASGRAQGLVVLAMGKLGAGELNFSSDIDLIFAYPEGGRTDGADPLDNDAFFTTLGRQLIRTLAASTADGRVFRVDMGLRPFGESGPIAMSFDAMESYYQTQGREWERYAWIKARAAAGDREAGDRLIGDLRPYVYRRYFDFGVFESLREMKAGIAREVRKKRLENNVKLGAGGIREIEFFGQMFQLIRGGVVPELKAREIGKVLENLALKRLVPETVTAELRAAYGFLRKVENRLQEFSDRQTHDLPDDPLARERLAAAMDYDGWPAFHRRLKAHREAVHRHFATLLESAEGGEDRRAPAVELSEIWLGNADPENSRKRLLELGFQAPEEVPPLLANLREAPATRALSVEGRRRLDLVVPRVLKHAGAAGHPVPVLNRVVELLKTIQRRTSYLSLLLENPAVLAHLVKFSDASPWIVSFLARHPVLLDELVDPRTLYSPPDKAELEREAARKLDAAGGDDLESFIETLCIFKQVNTLRVVAADVTGALPLMKVSDRLSWIAETILGRVLAHAWDELAARHGPPACAAASPGEPCRGFAVIAYGKLGGLELGYDSDLDLVFLHDAAAGAATRGPRPLDDSQFFARLGQRMIHILTAHTRAGRLYETDMRLRPSGSAGPLVSRIDAFREYHMNDAWFWENQAIVRARSICGDARLTARFEQIRREVLDRPRDGGRLREEVRAMRERMRREAAGGKAGGFHLKEGRGGMVDVEFLAQYLVLLESHRHPGLSRWSDNVRILESLTETGILHEGAAADLKLAYLTYRAAAHRLSLQEKPPVVPRERFAELTRRVRRIWETFLAP